MQSTIVKSVKVEVKLERPLPGWCELLVAIDGHVYPARRSRAEGDACIAVLKPVGRAQLQGTYIIDGGRAERAVIEERAVTLVKVKTRGGGGCGDS